jgi:hypothetical protein
MTSVHKILRQRDQATSILSSIDVENPQNSFWYLVPTSGNYIGNYPPGYMLRVPSSQIPPGALTRDMGKTIKASAKSRNGSTTGFFRAVQLITPDAVSATRKTTFGVYGNAPRSLRPGNIGDMGYRTYYIPIVVNETIGSISVRDEPTDSIIVLPILPISPYPPLGGQM